MDQETRPRVQLSVELFPHLYRRRSERIKLKSAADMDETSGRGHREKKPSEKLKEQVVAKIDKIEDDKTIVLPTYIAPNDPKFLQSQKEIPKILDHSKIAPNGDAIEFYNLGTQYEPTPSFIRSHY
jgi:hypothetical protein